MKTLLALKVRLGSMFVSKCMELAIVGCLMAASPVAASDPIALDPRVEAAEQERIAAVERAMPSTVSIFVPGGGGGGSGVLISPDGFALTNFHVTSPAGNYMRCGLSDGRIYDAVLVGVDPVGDLALIRLLGKDSFPYAEMADSRQARVGQWCMVIGNPFLLNTNLRPSVSWGILSGVGRYQYPSGTLLEYADCLQTDASINPGNSGGPLYDANGRLLGIVGRASFEKRGRVNVGVGYAISIQQAKNFLGDLHSGRIVDHATLGATVATDPEGGVRVSNILESSDAYRRGLRYGDEILEIDGRAVHTANQVQNVLATLPALWRVKLTYRNEEETRSTIVRLASVHGPDELLQKMAAALPPPPPAPDPKPEKAEGPEGDDEDDSEPKADPKQRGPKIIPEPDPHGDAKPSEEKTELPDAVKALFVARRGYANYHFNVLQQQSFMESLRGQFPGDKSPDDHQAWTIEGVTLGQDAKPVLIRVADAGFELTIDDKSVIAESKAELFDAITSRNAAGVLACIDSWRRMLRDGTDKFGECYYRGTVPLLGERPLRDWMVGISGELESSWLLHPETKSVDAVEVSADRDDDPAELLIRWSAKPAEQPLELELRYGTESVLVLRIESWKFGSTAEPKE
ncbi:MAG: S1C family serine protease [Planctomycetaceae bacterium]